MASLISCSVGVPAAIPRQCSRFGCEGSARSASRSGSVRCRAAAAENGSHFAQFLNLESLDNALQVFRDESKGIVCYRTPTGEITCEGIDEGPHFQPAAENQKGFLLSQLLFAKGAEEPLVNGAGI